MFRQKHTLEVRKEESSRILSKYPERIPVICERANNNIRAADYRDIENLLVKSFEILNY